MGYGGSTSSSSSSSSSSSGEPVARPVVLNAGQQHRSSQSSDSGSETSEDSQGNAIVRPKTGRPTSSIARRRIDSDSSSCATATVATPQAVRSPAAASKPMRLGPPSDSEDSPVAQSKSSPIVRTFNLDKSDDRSTSPMVTGQESSQNLRPGVLNATSTVDCRGSPATADEPCEDKRSPDSAKGIVILKQDDVLDSQSQQIAPQDRRQHLFSDISTESDLEQRSAVDDLRKAEDDEMVKQQLQKQQVLEQQEEERRQLEHRKEVEEAQRKKAQEEIDQEVKRKQEEEIRQQQEAVNKLQSEAQDLQLREAAFWSALSPAEAERMRGMLKAVALYQQQLLQNDQILADLHEQVKSKELAYQNMRQRFQQASEDTQQAREQEEKAKNELAKWTKKHDRYEGTAEDITAVQSRHQSQQAELARVREQAAPVLADAADMRDRLKSSDVACGEMAKRLVDLKAKCQQTVSSLKAEHVEEMAKLRTQQAEELSRNEVEALNYLNELRVKHAEESSKLRLSLDQASRRRDRLRHDRDATADQLLEAQREGQRVQRQYADARQEVLELSVQLRSSVHNSSSSKPPRSTMLGRSASLGRVGSASASPTLDASLDRSQDRSQANAELSAYRQRCKALEQQCARTHEALQRKQADCERWRKRSFEAGHLLKQSVMSRKSGHAALSGKAGPFTLGPMESSTDLMLLSPNGTRSL